MTSLRAFIARLLSQFRSRDLDRRLDEEINSHLELAIAEHVARGMTAEDARTMALRAFGGVLQTKEAHREVRSFRAFDALAQDLRYAFRSYRRTPMFTFVALATLVLAIGANTAVFSLLNALVLRDLPVRDPRSLVQISTLAPPSFSFETGLSFPMLIELERQQTAFSSLIPWRFNGTINVDVDGETTGAAVWAVGGNFYSELGLKPAAGRFLFEDDVHLTTLKPSSVAVLGYGFWHRRFGGNPGVIGRTVRVEDVPFTVVGVAPRGFTAFGLTVEPDVTVPLTAYPLLAGATIDSLRVSGSLSVRVTGRLKPGVTLSQAYAELTTLWPNIKAATVPTSYTGPQRDAALMTRLSVTSAAKGVEPRLRAQFTEPLVIVLGIALLILLIACVNLASLMLSRAAARGHEISVRVALGAGQWRLAQQMLTEGLLLSTVGAAAGVWFALWSSRAIVAVMFADYLIPASLDVTPDTRVLTFTAALAILVGALFSLAPIWRVVSQQPSAQFTHGTRTIPGMGRVGKSLVAVQIGLSLVLLTHAGLLVRTLSEIRGLDPGIRREGVVVAYPGAKPGGYKNVNNDIYYQEVIARLAALPGVKRASISLFKPAGGGGGGNELVSTVTDESVLTQGIGSTRTPVSPGFLDTVGIPLLEGRDFDWRDNSKGRRVTILSRSLARRLFGSGDAIGQHVRIGTQPGRQDVEVVGIVADARLYDLKSANVFAAYLPALQDPNVNFKAFVLKGQDIPFTELRRSVESLGHERVGEIQTLDYITDRALVGERITATLAGFFGGLALLLAAIGLYGLMSYSVAQRQREIGIRVALGARPGMVMTEVVRDGLQVTLVGVCCGMAAALVTVPLLKSLLFGITPRDPLTLVVASTSLIAVAVMACALPAARAARVDPMVALRAE